MLSGSSDLKIHPFRFGPDGKFTGTLAFIDGLVDNPTLTEAILRPIMSWRPDGKTLPEAQELADVFAQVVLCAGDVKEASLLSELASGCLAGDTAVLLDGCPAGFVVSTKVGTSAALHRAPIRDSGTRPSARIYRKSAHKYGAWIRRKD
jgi:spore germination protein KA